MPQSLRKVMIHIISFAMRLESWGDAPGWHETAPLALNSYGL